MFSLSKLWVIVVDFTNLLTLSTISGNVNQVPVMGGLGDMTGVKPSLGHKHRPPIFTPPGTNIPGFTCDYTAMGTDWSYCNDKDRTCWLQHKNGTQLNITTDYESVDLTPKGVTRTYYLNVTDYDINPDGVQFNLAKVFNNTFPGPLIEACWGDTVVINVTNKLAYNGTSVHWHGIRQLDTMHMDGVNGYVWCVTQCPIAPNDYFVYNWTAMQYGSSWYHSHYSVQYADGAQGPITIHGPTSEQYDYAIDPIIVGDWMNNSAFEVITGTTETYNDILLQGLGNINRFNNNTSQNTTNIPKGYEMYFEATEDPTRYLIRVINTAFTSSIVFSIDNHTLEVVEADFIPVQSFTTEAILIGIGQRYHFIVETLDPSTIKDGNFWIRTYTPKDNDSMTGIGSDYMKTGILRYDQTSGKDPVSPESYPWDVTAIINDPSDKPFNDQLQPMVNWTIGGPANGAHGEQFTALLAPGAVQQYYTGAFALQPQGERDTYAFQTDYGNPTFLNMGTNLGDTWPKGWVVVPENYTSSDWVFLNITSAFLQHPIHLHGHDFAILLQDDNTWPPPPNTPLRLQNPPRRDVVIIQQGGGAIIAFKADNPGVWLIHCHIALHASAGLGMQILESQNLANAIWPPGQSQALAETSRVCANWNSWAYDCRNAWPGNIGNATNPNWPSCQNAIELQNDAGI